jgi:hypothetical protein
MSGWILGPELDYFDRHVTVIKNQMYEQSTDAVEGALEKWLNIRYIWISSLFLMIGGGERMFTAVILSSVTDVTEHPER